MKNLFLRIFFKKLLYNYYYNCYNNSCNNKGDDVLSDTADVRKQNLNKIRAILRDGKEYTKLSIAEKTGFSVATCNTLLNILSQNKEVTSEQRKLQYVGRSSAVYCMNKDFECFLCIFYEMQKQKRALYTYIINAIGEVVKSNYSLYDELNEDVILNEVSILHSSYTNITQIIIAVPSLVENGMITYSDVPEMEQATLQKDLTQKTTLPVYIQNDMYFRLLGYYKKHNIDGVVTLANYVSHVLPGTATIYNGEILCGYTGLAGMVGFLPFDMDRKQICSLLNKEQCLPIIVKSIVSIITVVNPQTIVFTGDLIEQSMLQTIYNNCLKWIPQKHMPEMIFEQETQKYVIWGMYQKAILLKGELE